MATMEERVSRLEGAYEQVDRRLEELAASMQALRDEVKAEISDLRGEMSALRGEVNSRLNNLYLLMGGLWATFIVAGIVAIVLTN